MLLTPIQPFVGGRSGIWSVKLPSVLLKASKVLAALTDLGRQFHSLGALTAKEFSYKETALAGILRGRGGTLAMVPVLVRLSSSWKVIPISLFVMLLRIFHVWIIM